MIVGVFLRHYKIFRNINYIPLSNGDSFSAIIGDNGVGKSTILEALDKLLNDADGREWNINKPAIKEGGIEDPYIAPVFLIEKEETFKGKVGAVDKSDLIDKFGNYFWTSEYRTTTEAFDKFFEHRDKLKSKNLDQSYHLIIGGRKKDDNTSMYFGPYHAKSSKGPKGVLDNIFGDQTIGKHAKNLGSFLDDIINRYKYIYLPVDIDIYDYSKLESESMQYLMDRQIHNEIKKVFSSDILSDINDSLEDYIDEIQDLMEGYKYDKIGRKYKLTQKDLADKAIEAYFSIKILHKERNSSSIPIDQLSSGEKRKALIDLAYSFLSQSNRQSKKVILAIDEPESSINVSSCYDQFEKVKELSNENQVLITTHWYGFLPILMDGQLIFLTLEKDNAVRSEPLKLGNIPEQLRHLKEELKGQLPFGVQIKSKTDLVQSIISSLQADQPYNWLICEGSSEKIYFEYFLSDLIQEKNLRVLPVGGNSAVKQFYNYLTTPIADSDLEISGKVICLIDTDRKRLEVDINQSLHDKGKIEFYRLLVKEEEIDLLRADKNLVHPPTEIEDALNPVIFRRVLRKLADKELKKVIGDFAKKKGSNISAQAYDLTSDQNKELKAFFSRNEGDNKLKFAKEYVAKSASYKNDHTPQWIHQLKELFE